MNKLHKTIFKKYTGIFLPGFVLLLFTQLSLAQNRCGAPYFKLPETAKGHFLLTESAADVQVAGVIAAVELTQVYENKSKEPIEAVYVFPASDQAAIHALNMKIGERTIHAQIEEKNKARKDYNKAKSEGRTASLLEQHRPNVFQMNVANIMPGDKIEVKVLYSELLVPEDSVYELVLPKSVGPRYTGEDTDATPDDWAVKSNDKNLVTNLPQMEISVCLDAGMPIGKVESLSHQIDIQEDGLSKIITPDKENPGNNTSDFILRYALKGNKIQQGLLLHEGAHENFFLLTMQAPKRISNNDIPPREFIFLLDVSGSMNGFPLDISKKLFKDLAAKLRPVDKFNICFFAGGANMLAENSLTANKANVDKAIAMLESMSGAGGTKMFQAITRAMSQPKTPGTSRTFVILTDGYISVEKECYDYIRNHLGQANFFAFGIGDRVNRFLINGIARAGGGEPFVVNNKAIALEKSEQFRRYIQTPVLTDIKVDFENINAYDVSPKNIPDLMAERPIVVFGKYKGKANGKINVSGKQGKKKFAENVDFKSKNATAKYESLSKLWARNEVRELGDYKGLGHSRKDTNIIQKITDLGLQYNLMTSYTSFIAIDSEIRNNVSTGDPGSEDGRADFEPQPAYMPAVTNYGLEERVMEAPVTISALKMDEEIEIEPPRTTAPPPPPPPPPPPEPEVEEIFRVVEQMPRFPGCENEPEMKAKEECAKQKLLAFLYNNIQYPENLKNTGITGRVVVSFTVKKDGRISDIKITRSLHPEIDNEVLRVVKMMPKWIPGTQRGKPVDVSYHLPVKIGLE